MSDAQPAKECELRLWPAVILIIIQWCVIATVYFLGATTLGDVIATLAAPALTSLLLLLWWLIGSRLGVWERLGGTILFVGSLAGIYLMEDAYGGMVLIGTLPVTNTAIVAALFLARPLGWPAQRWAGIVVLVVCVGVCSQLRQDGMAGDLKPRLAWKWSVAPTPGLGNLVNVAARLPESVGPQDWPQFRGPNQDSVVTGVSLPGDWDGASAEVWRRPVGAGWSSFCVVGRYFFTQEQSETEELVTCYEVESGEPVWAARVTERFDDVMGPGPRATPTYDSGQLFTLGATGILLCIGATTGDIMWRHDLKADTGARIPIWGFSSSPLLHDNLVHVYAGGPEGKGVAAYHRASGKLIWTGGIGGPGYGTMHRAELSGVPQLLMISSWGIESFTGKAGQVLWSHQWSVKSNPRVVQPALPGNNAVLLGTADNMGTRRLRVFQENGTWTAEEEWTTKKFRPYFNDYVLHNGYCYGFDGNRLTCIDAATGERQWRGERSGGQLLLLKDSARLIVLSEKGKLLLVDATPEGFNKTAEFQAIEGKTWNHPVVAQGKLFVRNDREMACFTLPAG